MQRACNRNRNSTNCINDCWTHRHLALFNIPRPHPPCSDWTWHTWRCYRAQTTTTHIGICALSHKIPPCFFVLVHNPGLMDHVMKTGKLKTAGKKGESESCETHWRLKAYAEEGECMAWNRMAFYHAWRTFMLACLLGLACLGTHWNGGERSRQAIIKGLKGSRASNQGMLQPTGPRGHVPE